MTHNAVSQFSPAAFPLVSIVIPAYNCEATVAATVESCLAQTYPSVQVLVVNDGSTDGTAAVLARFGERITVVHQKNGGLANARNNGAAASRGEFIAWMDADDLMQPDRIQLQAAVLCSDPAVALVSSDFSAFKNDEPDFEASHINSYYSSPGRLGGLHKIYPDTREIAGADGASVKVRTGDAYQPLLSGNFVHPPTVLVRRSACDAAGRFDEGMRYNSDYDYLVRLARRGRFALVDRALLRYRRSDLQMSRAARDKIPLETIETLEKVRREDPEAYRGREAWLRERLADLHVNAAHIIGSADRARALRLLRLGVGYKLRPRKAAYAFARIMVPRTVVTTVKSTWRSLVVGAHCLVLGFSDAVPDSVSSIVG